MIRLRHLRTRSPTRRHGGVASAGWPHAIAPVVALGIGLTLWQVAVVFFDIPKILLPPPTDVLNTIWTERSALAGATFITAAAATSGLGLSLISGTLIAMLFSQSCWLRNGLFPYAIFLQTVPIVAIAPLIVIWMGEGFLSVVIISWIVSVFPMITNGTAGMLRIPVAQRELFQLCRATRWQTLRQLQLPAATPSLVTGSRIASGLAVLGAIVGEYFAGAGASHPGLGYLIFAAKDRFALDLLFASVLLCTTLGVIMFSVVGSIGQWGLLQWIESD